MSSNNPYNSPFPPAKPLPGGRREASALDAIIPSNPFAAIACWAGILSLLFCMVGLILGPLAIIMSLLAFKKWNFNESSYGATTSKVRAWIGLITGIIGTLLGVVFAIMMLGMLLSQ